VAAALAGWGAHTLFGTVTVLVYDISGYWPAGVAAAYLLHVGWNALVTGKVDAGR